MDINETLKERGSRYGDFKTHADITQALKRVMRCEETMTCNDNWDRLSPDKKEALEMIAHKIARIINGDPSYAESWRDIAGYAQLVVKELHRTNGATDARVVMQVVVDGKLTDMHLYSTKLDEDHD